MTTFAYIYTDPLLDLDSSLPKWDIKVDRVYQDWGGRQELDRLLRDCQTEDPQSLLLRNLSELGDDLPQITTNCLLFKQLQIQVIACLDGYDSAQDQDDSLLWQLLSEIPRSLQSSRLRQGHARNRLQALPPPGKAPYGYRRGQDRYLLDRSTAPVVKDFFEHFLIYGSLRGAVRFLEKRYGKKIAVSTGRHWLTSPVYRGDLIYEDQFTIPDTHPAIISREEAAQVDRLLRRNQQFSARTASASRSLAGLVVCQSCRSSMTIVSVNRRSRQATYLYLRPLNCPKTSKCSSISYQKVLETTIERICLDLPQAVTHLNTTKLDQVKQYLRSELDRLESLVEQITTLESQGVLDQETAQLRRYKIITEVAQTRTKLASLPPVSLPAIAQTASLPQFWQDLSETERRFFFREFIKQIEITPDLTPGWQVTLVFIF